MASESTRPQATVRTVSPKKILSVLEKYKVDATMPRAQRIAHFLDWAARNLPYQMLPDNLVLKAIQGYGHTPRMGTKEVLACGQTASSARAILVAEYKRGLHRENHMMRATVDDQDTADTQQRSNVKRLVSAHGAVKRTSEIIDPGKVKDETIKRWLVEGVNKTVKMLEYDSRLARLLPPKKDE